MVVPTGNIPTIFVAFGATGDLMRRKVVPSLYYLHQKNELPTRFRVVGFSRRDWSDKDYQDYILGVLEEFENKKLVRSSVEQFLKIFKFQQGTFEQTESYHALKRTFDACDKSWGQCANKLFYLAVAPEYYSLILKQLDKTALTESCDPGPPHGGSTSIIVEKPFGVDLRTAKKIDELLGKLFDEDQIYRIDHYLAKEMLQNILTFRFSNNLFEIPWGSELIESVHIKVLESVGVEKRGPFYESVGALRDVGQNHLLQMLALIAMERPASFDADEIQKKRTAILEALQPMTKKQVKEMTFRAQYKGYKDIPGVTKNSKTETYFRVTTLLSHPTWAGVPFVMESGKRMGNAHKEIVVTFKHPTPCMCPKEQPHHTNRVIFRMEPREEILIEFWAKRPGFTFRTDRKIIHYLHRDESAHVPYVEEYAKLLLDCVRGDQTLFISTKEIRAMWRFTDPILDAWGRNVVPLQTYTPDSHPQKK